MRSGIICLEIRPWTPSIGFHFPVHWLRQMILQAVWVTSGEPSATSNHCHQSLSTAAAGPCGPQRHAGGKPDSVYLKTHFSDTQNRYDSPHARNQRQKLTTRQLSAFIPIGVCLNAWSQGTTGLNGTEKHPEDALYFWRGQENRIWGGEDAGLSPGELLLGPGVEGVRRTWESLKSSQGIDFPPELVTQAGHSLVPPAMWQSDSLSLHTSVSHPERKISLKINKAEREDNMTVEGLHTGRQSQEDISHHRCLCPQVLFVLFQSLSFSVTFRSWVFFKWGLA